MAYAAGSGCACTHGEKVNRMGAAADGGAYLREMQDLRRKERVEGQSRRAHDVELEARGPVCEHDAGCVLGR